MVEGLWVVDCDGSWFCQFINSYKFFVFEGVSYLFDCCLDINWMLYGVFVEGGDEVVVLCWCWLNEWEVIGVQLV